MIIKTEFKSISWHRPCIIGTILCLFISIIISMKGVIAENEREDVIKKLPNIKDLDIYLTSLEKLIDFCMHHKLYVDLNFEFGLFLVNVNLKKMLKKKRRSMESSIRTRLGVLLKKNSELSGYFRLMVRKTSKNTSYAQDRKISQLFLNESIWSKYLGNLNINLLKQTKKYTVSKLEKMYGKFEDYENSVNNFDNFKPAPKESDACVASLAEDPPVDFNYEDPTVCNSSYECKQAVNGGTDFGYSLTHRLLFLIVSHFARGCTVFSVTEDKYKMDKYCMNCYKEVQYIAFNEYKLADLMMEQIALCSLIGHAQFLQRPWIFNLLRFQTSEGCFTDDLERIGRNEKPMREGKDDKWTLSSRYQLMMNGDCNGHVSGVAAAMLSATIRYIIENNKK